MIFFPGHLRCYLPVSKFSEKNCHKNQSAPDAKRSMMALEHKSVPGVKKKEKHLHFLHKSLL